MDIHSPHERWLKVAANLRVDRKDNIAPPKPLLLLVVAGLAVDAGSIVDAAHIHQFAASRKTASPSAKTPTGSSTKVFGRSPMTAE